MKDVEETPVAQLIISGMYGVDTFFVLRLHSLSKAM
jgi:hypothetical protein